MSHGILIPPRTEGVFLVSAQFFDLLPNRAEAGQTPCSTRSLSKSVSYPYGSLVLDKAGIPSDSSKTSKVFPNKH
jgi:hypothetical protein